MPGGNGSTIQHQRLFVYDEPGSPVSFIEPAPYGNYATTERSNFPSKLVSCRYCSSMLVFGEPMRWVTCIAAPILLADVGDHCFGVFSLDLKRGDERIFGVHRDVVRLPFQFKPDGELHPHAFFSHWGRHSSVSSPCVAKFVALQMLPAACYRTHQPVAWPSSQRRMFSTVS